MCCGLGEDFRCVCCGQDVKTSGKVCVLWSGCEVFR